MPFDLSQVMFIATANALDPIPAPLRDRMEMLELSGYTEDEKLHIARRYLLPKQIAANGLTADEITLPDETLVRIIRELHPRGGRAQPGARDRRASAARWRAQIAEGQSGAGRGDRRSVLRDLLGRPRFFDEVAERIDRPGVATGLVWTPVGGDIIFIEAAMMPSHENAADADRAARRRDEGVGAGGALLRALQRGARSASTRASSRTRRIHIHVPAGAIPKDGPSAGVTMMTALVVAGDGAQVRSDVAMTGEITLRGKVLPIGGLKEKVLAAHRAGIRTVILPQRNEPDLEDLPKDLRDQMRFIPVDDAREVLANALEGAGSQRPALLGIQDLGSQGMVASQGN